MQRKRNKGVRWPNQDEKDFQSWLKDRPCCVSGQSGVSVHHMYGSTFKHNKVLIGHWACIPLAYEFHQGRCGYHTIGQKTWRDVYGDQCNYWIVQHDIYVDEGGKPAPQEVINAIMDWGR
jgi:hypothetical protein